MNILLVHEYEMDKDRKVNYSGVVYHRMQKPFEVLHRLYPEIDYFTAPNLKPVPDNILDQTDLVLFSRGIPEEAAERLNKKGIMFGMDIDDYWVLDKDHLLFKHYQENGISQKIIDSLKRAHFVTCTTELLADQIKEHNKNIYVIENGIDTEDPLWQPNKTESKRLRFGFTQGEAHAPDLMMVSKDVARSFSDVKFYNRAQVALAGFRVHTETNRDSISGRTTVRRGSVQVAYERMLTDDLKAIKSPEYVYRLMSLLDVDGRDKPYRRIDYKPSYEFGQVYNEIDIIVVPLVNDLFNSCKSNLKMLEAGFKDCGVMVSHIAPYIPLATDKNSFDLSKKNFFEWQRWILNNPNDLEDRKAKLTEDVKPYSLNVLSKKRREIYEGCICIK